MSVPFIDDDRLQRGRIVVAMEDSLGEEESDDNVDGVVLVRRQNQETTK